MTREEIRQEVLAQLKRLAPEIDPASVRPNVDLRDEVDLDSMDFLHLITALHQRLGVDVPEVDYAKLATLDGAVEYLAKRLEKAEIRPAPPS
jgi:acyl carrier protein